jgi:putative endonuclease
MIEFSEGIYNFYVYILTNKAKTVLYTGFTNNLKRRLQEHKEKTNPNSFTAKYNVEFLVYYEHYGWVQQAIAREKEIKLLRRDLKLELIESVNPNFEFLNKELNFKTQWLISLINLGFKVNIIVLHPNIKTLFLNIVISALYLVEIFFCTFTNK